jgi:hypothetical protein
MRGACPGVSAARPGRAGGSARGQPVQRGCSRPWRPLGRRGAAGSPALSPGTGAPPSARAPSATRPRRRMPRRAGPPLSRGPSRKRPGGVSGPRLPAHRPGRPASNPRGRAPPGPAWARHAAVPWMAGSRATPRALWTQVAPAQGAARRRRTPHGRTAPRTVLGTGGTRAESPTERARHASAPRREHLPTGVGQPRRGARQRQGRQNALPEANDTPAEPQRKKWNIPSEGASVSRQQGAS